MRLPDQIIAEEIINFFSDKFELKVNSRNYKYAAYKESWLKILKLTPSSQDEAKTKQTVKKLQEHILLQFGSKRIKVEANVAENMTLRFTNDNTTDFILDTSKLMAFDILDIETGSAFEISLSDAFAEFYKVVLKGLLDSRVKKLYFCMRNHNYKTTKYGSIGKSGYIKVSSSPMVNQYIQLAKLYKLEIILIDLFPKCNL
ncbi:MAG: hypothetical protein JSS63_02330 [Bacteroidetes bacterium]|nr:hypothetical protein [Bacteroidota bacterium]